MCQFLKYLVHPSNRRDQLGVWEVAFFSLAEEIVFSFFNFLFDIFWNSINVAYVSQLGEEDLIYDYLFTSQCSLILFQIKIFLLYLRLFFPHLEFLRIELTKLTSSILMKIMAIPVVLVDRILFLDAPVHKRLIFF